VRFEVSKVLDAIEGSLSTDPALARAVVDLAEVVRYADLDGGRPATLLRLGLVVDALGRLLAEENAAVYVVVPRPLLSDADLTTNERMVVRRWADDGLVEVVSVGSGERALEVAELLGLPVLTRSRCDAHRDRHPWVAESGRLWAAVAGNGGPVLVPQVGKAAVPEANEPSPMGARLLTRIWRCPEATCASYGDAGDSDSPFADMRRYTNPVAQPPPSLRTGAPTCPRHETRLKDAGARPQAEVLSVRIGGVVRKRFVVAAGSPVVVGRAPEGGGIMLGQWLTDDARKWISRSHVRFELRGGELIAQDVSTNGTGLRPGGSMDDDERISMAREETRTLGDTDVVELYGGVLVGRSRNWATGGNADPQSVMAEAPTMSMRQLRR
jgi:hypothetical protein